MTTYDSIIQAYAGSSLSPTELESVKENFLLQQIKFYRTQNPDTTLTNDEIRALITPHMTFFRTLVPGVTLSDDAIQAQFTAYENFLSGKIANYRSGHPGTPLSDSQIRDLLLLDPTVLSAYVALFRSENPGIALSDAQIQTLLQNNETYIKQKILDFRAIYASTGLTDEQIRAIIVSDSLVQYSSFLTEYMQQVYGSTEVAAKISPAEQARRQIMNLIFDLTSEMAKALQNSFIVIGKMTSVNLKRQEAYTQAIAKVPILTSDPATSWITKTDAAGNLDLSKTLLGYGNINLQDIADKMAAAPAGIVTEFDIPVLNSAPYPSCVPVRFASASGYDIQVETSLHFTKRADGGSYVGLQLTEKVYNIDTNWTSLRGTQVQSACGNTGSDSTSSASWLNALQSVFTNHTNETQIYEYLIFPDGTTRTLGPTISNLQLVDSADKTMKQIRFNLGYDTLGAMFLTPPVTPPSEIRITVNDAHFPLSSYTATAYFPSPFPGSTDTTADTKAQQMRAERNAQLQQYISSLQAYKTALHDSVQGIQTSISQSNEAMSAQITQLSKIVDSMKSLISAIFR
jgi:hypothetical protein